MPLLDHPMDLAREMAKLLESDVVAAAQIKEHVPTCRLIELLNLSADDLPSTPEVRTFTEMMSESSFQPKDALEYVLRFYKKSEILEALHT